MREKISKLLAGLTIVGVCTLGIFFLRSFWLSLPLHTTPQIADTPRQPLLSPSSSPDKNDFLRTISTTTSILPTTTLTTTSAILSKKISNTASITKLTIGTPFDWLFGSSLTNYASLEAALYDVDTFDVSVTTIKELHKRGKKVVCYINVGSWEDWRSDKEAFPQEALGNEYAGWEGERWLDIRNPALRPIMQQRLNLAKNKGCDAIDPDNIDGYANDTGFPITAKEQITYDRWIAAEAHARGMSIGQKNAGELIGDLISSYDWALLESCVDQGWCAEFSPFIRQGKAVFDVEYTDSTITLSAACAAAHTYNFTVLIKHRNLDAWTENCSR